MHMIFRLLVSTLSVVITSYVLSGGVTVDNFFTAMVVAIVLGIVNTLIKPVLFLFTLPITILSFGLFTFVINGLLVVLVDFLVAGFAVNNFWWALAFSLLITIVSSFLNSLKD